MTCPRCQGHGILGGQFSGPHAGPWRQCDCSAGQTEDAARRVTEGNAARTKLLSSSEIIKRKLGSRRPNRVVDAENPNVLQALGYRPRDAEDVYNGDF